jgi:hypothetical protein
MHSPREASAWIDLPFLRKAAWEGFGRFPGPFPSRVAPSGDQGFSAALASDLSWPESCR